MKIFTIYGTFFLEERRPTVVHRSEVEGGTAVALRKSAMSHAFSGNFVFDEDAGTGEGNMIDSGGPSTIQVEHMTDNNLVFTKTYERSGASLAYEFTKHAEGFFEGSYEGSHVPTGRARCSVLELSPKIFRLD